MADGERPEIVDTTFALPPRPGDDDTRERAGFARRRVRWPLWGVVLFGLGSFFLGVCSASIPVATPATDESVVRIEEVLPRATTTSGELSTTTSDVATTLSPTTTGTAAPPSSTPVQGFRQAAPPSDCHESYPDFCIPPAPPDLDCGDVDGNDFTVHQPDPHGFDGNHDGRGCES